MANTYTSLHHHFIFSTKNREPWITRDIEQRVWAFMGGIASENKIHPVRIGGMDDHVHLLLDIPATLASAKVMQLIKGGSSTWIRTTFPTLAKSFAWQDGYGVFSVSKSSIEEVAGYITDQREHHRTRTFQEEYRAFLQRHGVAHEEKYLWE